MGLLLIPSGWLMGQIEEMNYRYLEILEGDKVMEKGMTEYFKVKNLFRLRLTLKSKLNGRNKIEVIDT